MNSRSTFDRSSFDALLRRRMFYTESFEIYRKASGFIGDNRGLYDLGPPGCALQANIIDLWRKHFVLEEDMLELDCTILTPEEVFKTSGHVDKFEDWMCKDVVTGEYIRADHLVKAVLQSRLQADVNNTALNDRTTISQYQTILAKLDSFDGQELADIIERFDIRNPDGNHIVLPPVPFNLMFKSSIGPSTAAPVYMRPETAQGQFVNFRKLLDHNNGAMPFASASIGRAFRNEISPRSGLLRAREFMLAEIEHFVDPESGKQHPRFEEVQDVRPPLLDRQTQDLGESDMRSITIGEAVAKGIVDNETLGYFLVRIFAFLVNIGIEYTGIRFRQHLAKEMAHYASDCWDAELLTSYGWIECVGCADRSAYDLNAHSKRTGERLVVQEPLKEPIRVTEWNAVFDKQAMGRTFKQDARAIQATVSDLSQNELGAFASNLEEKGEVEITIASVGDASNTVVLQKGMLSIEPSTRVQRVREYTPNVIEPSFGIGRILYCLLEHVYWHRLNRPERGVLSLPLSVAPTKVLIAPLSSDSCLDPAVKHISSKLRRLGISSRIDGSGASIGKRYARNDELGNSLGITVDFETLRDASVTLRDRDSTDQVRGSQDEVLTAVQSMLQGEESWADVYARLPKFDSAAGDGQTDD